MRGIAFSVFCKVADVSARKVLKSLLSVSYILSLNEVSSIFIRPRYICYDLFFDSYMMAVNTSPSPCQCGAAT